MKAKMFVGVALTALVMAFMACDTGNLPETNNSLDNGRFVAVESITGIPQYGEVGNSLALAAAVQVQPADATNKAIRWSITDAGATGAAIDGGTLTVSTAGTVALRATIANGTAAGTAYTKDFTVTLGTTVTMVARDSLINQLEWVKQNAENNGVYILTAWDDESLSSYGLEYGEKTGVTIILQGGSAVDHQYGNVTVSITYYNREIFSVGKGVTLILSDGITLRGRTSNSSPLVWVNTGGALIMNGGAITGNTVTNYSDYGGGGGVHVEKGGTFTMNDGVISGNTANYRGGGGVHLIGDSASFTMNGGIISGNTAVGEGGGVQATFGGTFTMNGGTISNNTARNGGGVYIAIDSAFTMNGGVISGNIADFRGYDDTINGDGGGVHVGHNASFTMNGGVISGNTAYGNDINDGRGGGVYQSWALFTMNGGVISGNIATGYGGGVYLGSLDKFTKTGGTIYGNDGYHLLLDSPVSGGNMKSEYNTVIKNGTVLAHRGHALYVPISSTKAWRRASTIWPSERTPFILIEGE